MALKTRQTFLALCTVLVPVTCIKANDCSSRRNCSPGWTKWNDTCYARTDEPLRWTESRNRCYKMGGETTAPRSQAENGFVRRLIEGSQEDHWIDCNDMKTERQWVCGGDSMQTYRNWAPSEPSNCGHPQCARMIPTGRWKDNHCSKSYYAICKYQIDNENFQLQSWRLLSSCLMGHVIRKFPAPSINGCAVKCSKEPGCLSFNVLRRGNERICQLNDARRFDVNQEEFIQMTKPLCIKVGTLVSFMQLHYDSTSQENATRTYLHSWRHYPLKTAWGRSLGLGPYGWKERKGDDFSFESETDVIQTFLWSKNDR